MKGKEGTQQNYYSQLRKAGIEAAGTRPYKYIHSTVSSFKDAIDTLHDSRSEGASRYVKKDFFKRQLEKQKKREELFYKTIGLNNFDEFNSLYQKVLKLDPTTLMMDSIREGLDTKFVKKNLLQDVMESTPLNKLLKIQSLVSTSFEAVNDLIISFQRLVLSAPIAASERTAFEQVLNSFKRQVDQGGALFNLKYKDLESGSFDLIKKEIAGTITGVKSDITGNLGEIGKFLVLETILDTMVKKSGGTFSYSSRKLGGSESKQDIQVNLKFEMERLGKEKSYGFSVKESETSTFRPKVVTSSIRNISGIFPSEVLRSRESISALQWYMANFAKLKKYSTDRILIGRTGLKNYYHFMKIFDDLFRALFVFYVGTDLKEDIKSTQHIDFLLIKDKIVPKSTVIAGLIEDSANYRSFLGSITISLRPNDYWNEPVLESTRNIESKKRLYSYDMYKRRALFDISEGRRSPGEYNNLFEKAYRIALDSDLEAFLNLKKLVK